MKKHPISCELLTAFLLGAIFWICFLFPVNSAGEWNVYLGQLHNHSGYMDNINTEGYFPSDAYAQAKAAGMDFFAVTDYSHSFENGSSGSIGSDGSAISSTWCLGKEAAQAATTGDFVAIYGYEMGWYPTQNLGHIVTLSTPGWQTRDQKGFGSLVNYYNALSSVAGSIGMYCHPGEAHGDFEAFTHHRWDYGDRMALLEVSGEDGETFFGAYDQALKAGWHVAPAASGNSHEGSWGASNVRTGILATSLSEKSLYDAIRARRVYATLDGNLEIQYWLGGNVMGSQVTGLDHYTAEFQLSETTGTVEIVSDTGVVASCGATEASVTVPAGKPYYYLRLVRDGETVAVTAPVWVTVPTDYGIQSLTAEPAVPVQNEEASLSFILYNHENVTMTLDSIRLTADRTVIWEGTKVLAAGAEETITVPYTHTGVGITRFKLTATGTIAGNPVDLEEELTLSYRPTVLSAHIAVDGRHSDVSYEDLDALTILAAKADMDVGIFLDGFPEEVKILIVPAPNKAFEEDYLQKLKEFVENGGQLVLCGTAGKNDRLNGLLSSLGATLRFHNDTALDPVNNGGTPDRLYPDEFHPTAWEGLTGSTFYCQLAGCTLDDGDGGWLVKGEETLEGDGTILLAAEAFGTGRIYAAGSFFLDDDHLVLPENEFDPPRANQVLMENLLGLQRNRLSLTDIKAVRSGTLGDIFRVIGYVTAGTSREHNRFPGLIYLQDETGGIEITAFDVPDIQVGTRLDITGQLHLDGKNPALKLISCEIIGDDLYRFDPDRLFHRSSMNYERHGGELMKVEGIAEDIELTEDGLGIRRFTLVDPMGYPAEVLIEAYICSGTQGENHLEAEFEAGDTVRAFGILHLEEGGNAVLRVRNCDEVTQIPPVPEIPEKSKKGQGKEDPTNPKTGDVSFTFSHLWSTMFQKEG